MSTVEERQRDWEEMIREESAWWVYGRWQDDHIRLGRVTYAVIRQLRGAK